MAKSKVNIQPLADRVVVKANEAETTTKSGIIIPDSAKEKPQKGEVIAIGEGKYGDLTGSLIPIKVKVGDSVLYGKYSGTEINIDGTDYLIMRESDILAIV